MTLKVDGTNGVLQAYDYQVSTTGFSYTFAAGVNVLVMNPAGTLATGTITMPAAPADGMTITISSTKLISALTLNGNTGQTVVSGVTVLPANQATTYVYRLSNTSWYPTTTVATNVPATPAGGSIITSGTAVASTSGTAIDFTGIPSWVKRVTVMLNGVSTGTAVGNLLFQVGSGSIVTTGYLTVSSSITTTVGTSTNTSGFLVALSTASCLFYGTAIFTNITGNTWVGNVTISDSSIPRTSIATGSIALGGALDRVRITTTSADTFDAGLINILYE
jgi:hypothetical protein